MRPPVFLDTAGLIGLAIPRDRWHEAATAAYHQVTSEGRPLVTTSLILTALADSLSAVNLRTLAATMRDRLLSSSSVEIIHVDPELDRAGWERYAARPDTEWGHTDCVSFVVMESCGITDALTADHHYRQAGFNCLIPIDVETR